MESENPTIASVMLKTLDTESVKTIGKIAFHRCTKYHGDKAERIYIDSFYDGFTDALNRMDQLIKMQTRKKI